MQLTLIDKAVKCPRSANIASVPDEIRTLLGCKHKLLTQWFGVYLFDANFTGYTEENSSEGEPTIFPSLLKEMNNVMGRKCTNNLWIPTHYVVQTKGKDCK